MKDLTRDGNPIIFCSTNGNKFLKNNFKDNLKHIIKIILRLKDYFLKMVSYCSGYGNVTFTTRRGQIAINTYLQNPHSSTSSTNFFLQPHGGYAEHVAAP